jgi:hypothetical protein
MSETRNTDSETFQRKVLETENQKLTYYTEKANKSASEEKTENLFINLSLKQIFINLTTAFVGILNDILTPGFEFRNILSVLTKEDRLIYVGMVILFVSFSIYLIDITG